MQKRIKSKAFTLIELSIVLVIIGLIVGGVLVGQDLIQAAKLRKVPQEISQIRTAVNVFKLKYNCIPGDCTTASQFFSGAINGDGDKMVDGDNTAYHGIEENDQFWEQLSQSELIAFNLVAVSDNNIARKAGVNLYPSAMNELAGYLVRDNSANPLYGRLGQLIMLSSYTSSSNTYPVSAVFTNAEMQLLDQKIDDGLASGGQVYATNGSGTSSCTDLGYTGTPPSTYLAVNDTLACRTFFWGNF